MGLLQAYGVDEIRDPQHIGVHGGRYLFVLKNGSTTGTTIGPKSSMNPSAPTMIPASSTLPPRSLSCPMTGYMFSDAGDSSGSIVLTRDSRLVGILTGGAALRTGPTSRTSPPTGGLSSRSRPSTPAASSKGHPVGMSRARQARRAADFFSADLSLLSLPLPSPPRFT